MTGAKRLPLCQASYNTMATASAKAQIVAKGPNGASNATAAASSANPMADTVAAPMSPA